VAVAQAFSLPIPAPAEPRANKQGPPFRRLRPHGTLIPSEAKGATIHRLRRRVAAWATPPAPRVGAPHPASAMRSGVPFARPDGPFEHLSAGGGTCGDLLHERPDHRA
jgi:hypothetical protein